ncbi:MAG TPA: VOC family protein [Terracidiphilus sp.]|nr:VOC family protein [Terracidiphilus sp.]
MSSVPLPEVQCDKVHPGVTAADVAAAVDFYTTRLGFKAGFTVGEPPTFAGVNLGNTQMFLGQGTPTPNPHTPAAYFAVEDADALYEYQRAQGVEIAVEIGDRPYGLRDYAVRDLNGYVIEFGQPLFNAGPPVPIERADVAVRLEKRLAALLRDLAEHKRMSVDSCLEEMILHTNDGVEPHTKGTLRFIQQLKQKHGIDYDCHASYRFVEK